LGQLVLGVILCAMPVAAQDDSPVFDLSFTFLTTPEVSIKLKAPNLGRPIRGKLIALSDGEVIVDTGVLSRRDRERGERGQRVPFSRMESLRSSDGRFEFTPDEGFKVIAQKVVDTYPSIRTEGNVSALQMDRPPRVRSKKKGDDDEPEPASPNDTAESEMEEESSSTASGKKTPPKKTMGIGNKGIGGIKSLPKVNKSVQEQAEDEESADQMEDSEPEVEETGLADATEEHYCSNCNKRLSRSALKKEECPHCGTTFVMPKASSSRPSGSAQTSGHGAFAPAGSASAPTGGAFAPAGSAPVAEGAPAAGQTTSSTVVIQGGGGFSFDQVPTWAKGGIFVLVILVGYHVLFNR
jgi:predicted RNA-binding Zn-ribbon protein involved in translation (DUF1610 family)